MKKLNIFIILLLFVSFIPVSQVHAASNESVIVSHTIPSQMQAGVTYPVSITVKNTSNMVWTDEGQFKLGGVGDSDPFATGREHLPHRQTIAPGEMVTFSFDMKAPDTPGDYITDWQMVQEYVRWFGSILTVNVQVHRTLPSRAGTILSDTIPSSMLKGQVYPVSVTVRNDGGDTWTDDTLYRLGAVGDQDDFADGRAYLPDHKAVPPGAVVTFSFNMKAPEKTGNYLTDWRMVHEGVSWFGAILTKQVSVQNELPPRMATVLNDTIPSFMAKGQTYPVTVTIRNDGGDVWTEEALYKLGAVGDQDDFASGRVSLPDHKPVPPGAVVTFSFNMKAPDATGNYITDWRMVQDGVSWFGGIVIKSVSVLDPVREASITWHNVPSMMGTGETLSVLVTVRNDGNVMWTEHDQYRLAVDQKNGYFTNGRVLLPTGIAIAPGQSYTFTIPLKAPQAAGNYSVEWIMLQEHVTTFGTRLSTPIAVVDSNGFVRTQYDKAGRLITVSLPSGEVVHYNYDRNGNLLSTQIQKP